MPEEQKCAHEPDLPSNKEIRRWKCLPLINEDAYHKTVNDVMILNGGNKQDENRQER